MHAHKLEDQKDLAPGDAYATKGFILDYGVDFKERVGLLDLNQLRKFDVTPYKDMHFKELKRTAEALVR